MSQDRILDRVRKLMALANNAAATEGERDNAMRMAHATLAKHNLTMAEVPTDQQEVREQQMVKLSVFPWARSIAHSLGDLFFCKYYYCRPWKGKLADHYFIGRQSNAITAAEMSQYVVNSVFKELRARYGNETSPEARSFATGVADRLRARVAQLQRAPLADATPGTALVLASLYKTEAQANDAWLDATGEKLTTGKDLTKKEIVGGAYRAGKEHGDKISLNTQLGETTSRLKRIGN